MYRLRIVFYESCDPVIPCAPTLRGPIHRINLLKKLIYSEVLQGLTIGFSAIVIINKEMNFKKREKKQDQN